MIGYELFCPKCKNTGVDMKIDNVEPEIEKVGLDEFEDYLKKDPVKRTYTLTYSCNSCNYWIEVVRET